MLKWIARVTALVLAATPAAAEEGMWTFDHVPADAMRSAYNWAPDQPWLDRAMRGAARVAGGCSAAVASGEGLVLTNSHCVAVCARNTEPDAPAFVADARAAERRCPGLVIDVMESLTDVTADIDRAAAGAADFARARDAEIARLTRACATDGRWCEVVTLYQGAHYHLHTYRRYTDVRLVFAPERRAAYFNGAADNFRFPRTAFDVALVRLYANGAPARTPDHLQLRPTPLANGEMTLVAGHPGPTERSLTAAQLIFQRDVFLPQRARALADLRTRLANYASRGPLEAQSASAPLFTLDNTLRAIELRRAALARPDALARVEAAERDLQARVRRNAAATRETGDAWNEIAAATRAYATFIAPYQYAEARPGEGSELIGWARALTRWADERDTPEAERLRAYTGPRLAALRANVTGVSATDPGLEQTLIEFWLARIAAELGASPLSRRILNGEAPPALAQRLVTTTTLLDAGVRTRYWEEGAAAIATTPDPLLEFMQRFDGDARVLRSRYETEVEAPIARAQERISRARYRTFGRDLAPETTFTLRLSYGRVAGWREPAGPEIAPVTRVSDLYTRAGAAPDLLSPTWAGAQSKLDANMVFNAVTTNDIIGGNSGSPVLDRSGAVVGIVFDGNEYSLGGAYFYDQNLNRTVIVTSPIILAALERVYGMESVARELRAE